MNRLASPAQLRASVIRWALFLVPSIVLLGFLEFAEAECDDAKIVPRDRQRRRQTRRFVQVTQGLIEASLSLERQRERVVRLRVAGIER